VVWDSSEDHLKALLLELEYFLQMSVHLLGMNMYRLFLGGVERYLLHERTGGVRWRRIGPLVGSCSWRLAGASSNRVVGGNAVEDVKEDEQRGE
jgi:hypothetical protein